MEFKIDSEADGGGSVEIEEWELPSTVASAKEQLSDLFSCEQWAESRQACHWKALTILQTYPELASASFDTQWRPSTSQYPALKLRPLSHFLHVPQVDLETIKVVYELCPELVTKNAHYGILPLHVACSSEAGSKEIIEFLIGTYPNGRNRRDSNSNAPFYHYVMRCVSKERSEARFAEVLEVCDRLLDTAFLKREFEHSPACRALLMEVIYHNCRPIIEFFISKLPDSFWMKRLLFQPNTLDMTAALGLELALSKLKCLHITLYGEVAVPEAVHFIFQRLCNSTVQVLTLQFPFDNTTVYHDLLTSLLQTNAHLRSLEMYLGPDVGIASSSQCLRSIITGLAENKGVKHLTLNRFQISDCADFCQLLHKSPQHLRLFECRISTRSENAANRPPPHTWRSGLTHLEIERCKFREGSLKKFLEMSDNLRSLQYLHLHYNSFCYGAPENLAEELSFFVNKVPLIFLQIFGLDHLNAVAFCQQLSANETLKDLTLHDVASEYDDIYREVVRMLGVTNTSLEKFSCTMTSSDVQTHLIAKIEYFTTLNRYGRERMRHVDCYPDEFVRLISSERFPSEQEPLKRANILYGLMRESPSCWSKTSIRGNTSQRDSHGEVSRKRKWAG